MTYTRGWVDTLPAAEHLSGEVINAQVSHDEDRGLNLPSLLSHQAVEMGIWFLLELGKKRRSGMILTVSFLRVLTGHGKYEH